MKQVIRLTESDLHRMIKESVNQVLNELSSNTYEKAQEKAAKLGRTNQADNFNKRLEPLRKEKEKIYTQQQKDYKNEYDKQWNSWQSRNRLNK